MRGWWTPFLALGVAQAAPNYRRPVIGDVTVTAYYDTGGTRDWNCGGNTYGGHRGTDIAIIGRFAAQDAGRDVVAAADGRVITTHDGEFDRCTTADCPGGGGYGNYIRIEHADGKHTIYGHLRRGSVRVNQGDRVTCGQRIALVGSSGFSTGPHLHFEVRRGEARDDPFQGQCSRDNTYWVEQGAYNGLPAPRCEMTEPPPPPPPPPPPMKPDLHLRSNWVVPERRCDFDDCRDFVRGGRSGDITDAWIGESLQLQFEVKNQGNASTAAETPEDAALTVAYALPSGWTIERYLIESDHPNGDRMTWARNDAMDNEANPPEDVVPNEGRLRLNGMSPGESKRVTFWVWPRGRTVPNDAEHLRFWVAHARNYYGEKDGWDDAVETNDGQTFNGGDLRVERRLDVFDPLRFEFDAADPELLEGWRSCAPDVVTGLRAEGGALVVESQGPGACVESPPLRVDVAGLPGLRVTLRDAQAAMGQVAWTTEAAPEFGAERTRAFRTPGAGVDYVLHLAPRWDGVVTRLRVWPGTQNAAIESVEIVDTAPEPRPRPPARDGGVEEGRDGGAPDLTDAGRLLPRADGGQPADEDPETTGVSSDGGCSSTPAPSVISLMILALAVRRRRSTPD